MTEKRFTISQNGNFHTVRDTVEKKPLGMFEFKENEFPVYACFHHIIDLLNEFYDENEQLKQQLAHHTRMHEWFRNEAYLLQNKLDNREYEIRRLKGDVE